jgi:hypothetical protein
VTHCPDGATRTIIISPTGLRAHRTLPGDIGEDQLLEAKGQR